MRSKGFRSTCKVAGLFLSAIVLVSGCTAPSNAEGMPDPAEWGTDSAASRSSYIKTMTYLAGGRQSDAERTIVHATFDYPEAQRLLFLRGVLERSRFQTEQSCGTFAQVYRLDPANMMGRAANIVVSMDYGNGVETGFAELISLIKEYPGEPLLRWLYIIEAVGRKPYAEEALALCEGLLQEWNIGPVTLHKAYANFLVVVRNDPAAALEQRMLAAEMEPVANNYEGVARTLEIMNRYNEAEPVYAKMVELEPDTAIRWFQWGNCLAHLEDFSVAAEKFEKAYVLDPSEVMSLLCWGRCLERLGQPQQGFKKYELAVRENPHDQQVAAYVAHAQLYGYGTACDFEAALKASANQGRPAISVLRERVRLANRSDNPLAPEHSDVLLRHLTALAEDGDPEAQYSLGMIYKNGIGVERNEAASMLWIRRASEHGHAIAGRIMNPPL